MAGQAPVMVMSKRPCQPRVRPLWCCGRCARASGALICTTHATRAPLRARAGCGARRPSLEPICGIVSRARAGCLYVSVVLEFAASSDAHQHTWCMCVDYYQQGAQRGLGVPGRARHWRCPYHVLLRLDLPHAGTIVSDCRQSDPFAYVQMTITSERQEETPLQRISAQPR